MPGYRARFVIKRKKGVLDPEGTTIFEAMGKLGYGYVKNLSTGKIFDIELEAVDTDSARERLKEIGQKVLSNPVIEEAVVVELEKI